MKFHKLPVRGYKKSRLPKSIRLNPYHRYSWEPPLTNKEKLTRLKERRQNNIVWSGYSGEE